MRRTLLVFFMLVLCHLSIMAAIVTINVDKETIAAMGKAYQVEAKTEKNALVSLDSIFNHYTSATASTGVIYEAAKWRHNALRSTKMFDSSEFFYYQRIKYIVANLIMPKLIVVAYGMVQHPENFMYWGPYLYKTTQEVESLCKQFQLVVTNNRLNFNDVQFLVLNEALGKYIDLAKLGDVDWKELLGNLSNFGHGLSWADIEDDFKNITSTIGNIATTTIDKNFEQASHLGYVFHASREEIVELYKEFKGVYNIYKDVDSYKDGLMRVIQTADPEGVQRLFKVSNYNISNYMVSYLKELQGQYYKQHFYIKKTSGGKKKIIDFIPTKGYPNEIKTNSAPSGWGEEWVMNAGYDYRGKGPGNQAEILADGNYPHVSNNSNVLRHVLDYIGYSDQWIGDYQTSHPGHTIVKDTKLYHFDRVHYKGKKGNHNRNDKFCFKSYSVTLTDEWKTDTILYDEVFDSQTMDLATFKKKLRILLDGYKNETSDLTDEEKKNNVEYKYELTFDAPQYYSVADDNKVKSCASVTFKAKCSGGQTLAEGGFSWKENGKQGNKLDDNSKKFAMASNQEYSDDEIKQFTLQEKEYDNEIAQLNKQISSINNQMSTVQRQAQQAALSGDKNKQQQLNEQYRQLQFQKEDLQDRLSDYNQKKMDLNAAKNDYYQDLASTADNDKTRIKSNMAELQSVYQVEWTDEGQWVEGSDQYIWVRHGYSSVAKFPVTYTAKLSLKRKPKYFLGIRIHRAVLSVEYSMTSDQSSESIIETMKIDDGMSEAAVVEKVNKRQQELMKDYPDCVIDMEYNKKVEVDSEVNEEDGKHLLFATDRLDLARNIESRLVAIYAHLQMIERTLYARDTIKRFLTGILLDFTDDSKRKTMVEQCLYDWRDNAKYASINKTDSVSQKKQTSSSKVRTKNL